MNDGIAVVGLACRVPGAPDARMYWRNLCDGVEAISRFSDAELLAAGVDTELVRRPDYVPASGVLDDIERFDAAFFGFTPREAEVLDVQQRLFLECAWQALEDACCMPDRQNGVIGVYAGAGLNSYLLPNLALHRDLIASVGEFEAMISNDKDFLPTRVSYKLNLGGPSIGVQTACSTSLVAVHLACQALLGGECDVALAGGVSVRVPHRVGYLFREGMILSPDGHCRAFDIGATGTVGGNGVGVVVLKRLEDALADRDAIRAVVLGSAINNDGGTKVGFTAPSVDGQRGVIGEALAVAGVTPGSIGFIETHGTGTRLGDPIEFQALCEALPMSGRRVCALGAVKTAIGHLDAAAGVAGFIKTVLALEHGQIPPTLHFTQPNPAVALDDSPFYINTTPVPWSGNGAPRRAGVSSFGIGGTNAHVVLEQAPEPASSAPPPGPHVILVSARDQETLARSTAQLARTLRHGVGDRMADVAWSLQHGRRAFAQRVAIVGRDAQTLALALDHVEIVEQTSDRTLIWMFPGQGAQHTDMAAELYRAEPVFRDTIDACSDMLRPGLGLDLRDVLGVGDGPTMVSTRLEQTAVAQPALFAVEYGLARLLQSWEIEPDVVLGHSVGEYAAACVAEVITLPEALKALVERGRLMQTQKPGRMLTVALSEAELEALVTPPVSVAAVNGAGLCVASGPSDAVAALERRCVDRGVSCQPLRTSHAFHSSMMEPVLPAFGQAIDQMSFAQTSVPWVSSVTGDLVSDAPVDAGYWVRQIRQPVRFADALTRAFEMPRPLMLEVGPGQTLSSLASAHPRARDATVVPTMRRPGGPGTDQGVLLEAIGRVWTAGVPVGWDAIQPGAGRHRMSLPGYPFRGSRYWIDPPDPDRAPTERPDPHARRQPLDAWFYAPMWKPVSAPVTRNDSPVRGVWLFLMHDGDLVGAALAARARARGAIVISVSSGTAYARSAEDQFTIRSGRADDYDRLLSELALGVAPIDVVHAWCLESPPGTDTAVRMTPLDAAFHSVLGVTRALSALAGDPSVGARDGAARCARLHVLSLVTPAGADDIADAAIRAAIQGPVRVGPRECPMLTSRCIQMTPPTGEAGLAATIERLDRELLWPDAETDIAYLDGLRHVRVMAPLQVGRDAEGSGRGVASGTPPAPLRHRGHYLITGGLGGIGLVVARHLALRCEARLTLLGRTTVPPKTGWDDWLAQHPDEDVVSRRIRQLRRIDTAGGQVWIATADVGDHEALDRAVEAAIAHHGPVHGVIHAAGVPAGGLIAGRTRGQVDSVFGPKVDGALNLIRALDEQSLDFLVFMSSLTAVLGEVGQVDYCAANAVLDELAVRLRGAGRVACSINWDAWRETGMAASASLPAGLESIRQRRLRDGILDREGLEVFERVLADDLARVVVSTRDLETRVEEEADTGSGSVPRIEPPERNHPRPVLSVPFAAADGAIEQEVCLLWEAVLGVDGVGRDDDFFELGGHSLLATQLLSRLRDQTGVGVSLGAFFEQPSVAALARVVEATQLDAVVAEVEQLSEDEAEQALRAAAEAPDA